MTPRRVNEAACSATRDADRIFPSADDEAPILVVAQRTVQVRDHVIVWFGPHRVLYLFHVLSGEVFRQYGCGPRWYLRNVSGPGRVT